MSNRNSVAALKEQLETLFPGKLYSPANSKRSIATGLQQIDQGITHVLMRRRISEWVGSESSGKTTLLRQAIQHWCNTGLHVVYIDAQNRLVASDWAFVDKDSDQLLEPMQKTDRFGLNRQNSLFESSQKRRNGKFLVVRNLKEQDVFWSAEQLVRSNIFDVVILDTSRSSSLNSRSYARLQRALDRSKSTFVLVTQTPSFNQNIKEQTWSNSSWGCDSRFSYKWSGNVRCEIALNNVVAIQPDIGGSISRDGLNQNVEVSTKGNVANRLFTHPQIPDRRTPKTGT